MDIALLLILPVIGGYYFASNWNYTRFRSAREEGHRLYFRAVLYGTILFAATCVLRALLLEYSTTYATFELRIADPLGQLLKKDKDNPAFNGSGIVITSFYSLAIGASLWKPLNLLFREDRFLRKAVQNNDFERLVLTGVEKRSPLSMTMENHKVYVGFVAKAIDPGQARTALGILPVMSGHRSSDGSVEFTTYYSDVYQEIDRGDGGRLGHLTPEDFEIVLPVDKIVSANMFDIVAYEEFGRRSRGRRKKPSPTKPKRK